VKNARLHELQALLRIQQDDFNRAQIGQQFDVLFTGPGRHPGQFAGRSPYLQPVIVEATHLTTGQIAPVRITAANPNSLMANLTDVNIELSREHQAA
jgi:tRNA-2-methylthio-N6-dimethylallyladenosine synthase